MPEQQSTSRKLDIERSHLFSDDEVVELFSDLFSKNDKNDISARLDAIENAVLFLAKRQSYE